MEPFGAVGCTRAKATPSIRIERYVQIRRAILVDGVYNSCVVTRLLGADLVGPRRHEVVYDRRGPLIGISAPAHPRRKKFGP